MTPKEQCDQLLNDRAQLLYGVNFDALDPEKQSYVICEALAKFNPRVVELADSLGGNA